MKLRGRLAILSQDGQSLGAVWGTVGAEKVTIEGGIVAQRPPELETGDAGAVGAWIGETLRSAGCSARACTIAVPRASVVLKRLAFPGMSDVYQGDLAGMVQLQMSRQLTMPLQGAAIDYVRLGEIGQAAGAETTEVLAAALPGENVAWCRDVAKAAKLKLRSVALRGEGSAALLAQLSYTQGGPILGVSIAPQGIELGIVSEGRVVFSRAVDLVPPASRDDWAAFGDRVAVEAKRTRVGYRGAGETGDIVCIAVIGEDRISAEVGNALGRELALPWQAMAFHSAIELPAAMDSATRAGLAPLIGLMLGAAIDRPTYDFANPRKAPDTSAPLRQAGLAAVLGLIVFCGAGYLVGAQRLTDLKNRVDTAEASAFQLQEKYIKQLRAGARLDHIERLRESGADWVKHLAYLSASMPPANEARLETIDGMLRTQTAFDGKTLQEGRWVSNRRLEFNLSGLASREVANELRAKLVMSKVYQAGTRGPDVSDKFEYQLISHTTSPDEVLTKEPTPEPDDAPAAPGGKS